MQEQRRDLDTQQAQIVIDSIPMFGNMIMEKGLIYEEDFDQFFEDFEGVDNHVQAPAHHQSLNNGSVHNQRAAIISNGCFRERVSMLEQDKQLQLVNKKWRKEDNRGKGESSGDCKAGESSTRQSRT